MRALVLIPSLLVPLLALAGCAAPAASDADDTISIVASTDVYGDIASTIGGANVTVTSILDDPSQDPHSFEGSARVQLALSKADLVIENGGGYDDWTDTLLAGADNADVTMLNAVDISGFDQSPAGGELNEHVWYDFPTVQKLVDRLVTELSALDPSKAEDFAAKGATFSASLTALEVRESDLAATVAGTGVAITEPVPLYLLTASGFTNVTPEAFSEAIEEGSDVSPAVLEQALDLFANGDAALLVYNEQTSGAETQRVIAAATAAGAGVVPVTETLPTGEHYLDWMSANLDAIAVAVQE